MEIKGKDAAQMKKVTNAAQKVAVDILTRFMFTQNMEEVIDVFHEVLERYELESDPFTKMPCTTKEYFDSVAEYERQTMMERYGHCDGLD